MKIKITDYRYEHPKVPASYDYVTNDRENLF